MSDELYRQVFENNRAWVEQMRGDDASFFEQLALGQNPEFLFIGCADSRVPANQVMGLAAGRVFVHRNIANVVPNTDMNVHTVIQYAVDHLGVEHVVVCGHYGCGGVAAAMGSDDLGLLNKWLREIRDVYRLHREELNAIDDKEARYRRLIELNVHEQCLHVIETSWVQKHWRRRRAPHVHGWVFDVASGQLIDLKIPFQETLDSIGEIYRIEAND